MLKNYCLSTAFLFSIVGLNAQSPGGVSSGLKAWFKNYAGGTTWTNSTTNTNLPSVTSGTAPGFISAGLNWNFNTAIDFSSTVSNDHFVRDIPSVNDFLSVSTGTLVSVFKDDTPSASMHAYGFFGSEGLRHDEFSSQSAGSWFRADIGTPGLYGWTPMSITANAIPAIIVSELERTASNSVVRNFYNNLANGGPSNFQSRDFSEVDVKRVYIGRITGNESDVDMAEAIAYNRVLTTAERKQVDSYLAAKYGITLGNNGTSTDYVNSSGSTFWSQSANSAYAWNIAGIARDDNSALHQNKSHSINKTGSVFNDIVTVAYGTNFSTPSAMNNNSFFFWGHNSGALINTNAILNLATDNNSDIIQTILSRKWKAQETGTLSTVTLEFNLSSIVGAGGTVGNNDLANLRLLVSEDGNYNYGEFTSIAPTSYNNATDIAYFQFDFVVPSGGNSTPNRGFYFTLGSTNINTTPLAVEIQNFNAIKNGNQVDLTWETKSERNTERFEVERTQNGYNWEVVLTQPSAGTSNQQLNYFDYDLNPYWGESYYRLKMINTDGSYSYSDIRKVTFNQNEDNIVVYPNPVTNNLFVQLQEIGTFEVTITDVSGKVVLQNTITTNSKNTIQTLDMSNLNNGVYFTTIKQNNEKPKTIKIVVTK